MNAFVQLAQEHGEETTEAVEHVDAFFGDLMWVVPLLPFLAFFVILFFGKRLPGRGHEAGIIAIGVAWLLSVVGFIELASKGEGAFVEKSWTWFEFANGFELELGMNYDFL